MRDLLSFFKKKDHVFALILILVFLVALLIFFQYENWILEPRIRGVTERQKVGTVSEVKNARRRYAGSMTYFDLKKESAIHIGDTLFTDQMASLEFGLDDGSKIRLGELTLVVIDKDKDFFRIFLAAGEISGELAPNSKIEFNIEQERIELRSEKRAEFKIQNTKMGETKLEGGKGKIKAKFKQKNIELGNTEEKLNSEVVNAATAPLVPPEIERSLGPTGTPVPSSKIELKELPLDLPIPFPADKQVFLVKQKGDIVIVPVRQCAVDCEMILLRDGLQVGQWQYKKSETPVIKIFLTSSDYGSYQVKLNESTSKKAMFSHGFDLKVFSKVDFEKALKEGLSVEVMD